MLQRVYAGNKTVLSVQERPTFGRLRSAPSHGAGKAIPVQEVQAGSSEGTSRRPESPRVVLVRGDACPRFFHVPKAPEDGTGSSSTADAGSGVEIGIGCSDQGTERPIEAGVLRGIWGSGVCVLRRDDLRVLDAGPHRSGRYEVPKAAEGGSKASEEKSYQQIRPRLVAVAQAAGIPVRVPGALLELQLCERDLRRMSSQESCNFVNDWTKQVFGKVIDV